MSRPGTSKKTKRGTLVLLAGAFSELGYRRAVTVETAARCGVQKTTLYQLWDGKKRLHAIQMIRLPSKIRM